MTKGYFMKIIEVDLTNEEIKVVDLKEEDAKNFIGGSGLGAKYLYELTDENTDPLGPENVLIFMTGPFAGTKVFSSDRYSVITKSPLTGIFAEADSGGRWGESFKKCGYDGIIIKGKAAKPVYISIKDDEIKINDASHLWGKGTFETDAIIKEEFDEKANTISIGNAGENLVKFACIMNEGRHGRAAGRAGGGAVMGSKNLKAIAVRGTKDVEIAEPEKLDQMIKKMAPGMVKNTEILRKYGTSCGVEAQEVSGDLPLKNWYLGNWKDAKKISGQSMAKTILIGNYNCGRCVIGCGRTVEVKEEPFQVKKGGGPEYETIGMLGTNLLVDDIRAVAKANEFCNDYGMDTISTGSVIGFAMEAYERGIIDDEDTGGIKLEWGNGQAVVEMIEKIAFRKGFGNVLADGVVEAANRIGGNSIEFAIHVKGLDLPAHDPRAKVSLALGYATSNRGACHVQGFTHDFEEGVALPDLGYPETLDRFETEGKAKFVFDMQNWMSLFDAVHLCKFVMFGGFTVEPMVKALNYVTGWNLSKEEFLKIGERLFNLKRLYNTRLGISRKDDTLPPRILNNPRGGGSGDNLPQLNEMLRDYYRLRGWDEFGIPTEETIKNLGLEEFAK